MSRLAFREAPPVLDAGCVAFIGGSETFGRGVDRPFPERVAAELGRPCGNFGVQQASVEAFIREPSVLDACRKAGVTVVQIMGAQNNSNRFYSVHPRRNDRFLRPSSVLQAIYADVDFSEFAFTRHMLRALRQVSQERFEIVRAELQEAWSARMRTLLDELGPRVVLLWFAVEPLADDDWGIRDHSFQADPLFVNRRMVEALRPRVADIIEVRPPHLSPAAQGFGLRGLPETLTAAAQAEAAAVLLPRLSEILAGAG